jgi:HEAT repeat protein
VLAILGVQGHARALDLLIGHVDDDRPAVRRWAVVAIENALPRDVATARLAAVQNQLRHADAKTAVQQALERISRRSESGHP